jgi:hypothetical protein
MRGRWMMDGCVLGVSFYMQHVFNATLKKKVSSIVRYNKELV